MVDKKRKARDESKQRRMKAGKNKKSKDSTTLESGNRGKRGRREYGGPRLPSSLRRDVDALNPTSFNDSDVSDNEEIFSDGEEFRTHDVYEYEEPEAEEESKKNRRYDSVDNMLYELPEDYEDEDVFSDDDANAEEEVDDESHARLLHDVTGMHAQAFVGKKRKNVVVSEAYPESEYNPTGDVLAGNGQFSMEDLLEPLKDMAGYNKLRKMLRSKDKGTHFQAPLSKAEQERIERTAAYEQSKKDVTKWEPLVRRNREAPTITFDENVNLGFSTVSAIASEFKPRTKFEKMMASLVHNDEVMEAERTDGAKLLELNKVSVEEVKDRQNRLAKMRSLLFRHEMKSKHIKKIKSKTYHRLLKKDRMKSATLELEKDPESAKALARKQEFERAKERMKLRHKNTSKWSKRILQRGLDIQDEGTRAAIAEQLREHERLTRKINSAKETSSSSDDSSDEDDIDDGDNPNAASKILDKAKEKTMELMEEEEDLANSSLLSLPFMTRGLKKKREVANEEAKLAIQEFEKLKEHVDKSRSDGEQEIPSGVRVFGGAQMCNGKPKVKVNSPPVVEDSDFDSDVELKNTLDVTEHVEERKSADADIDLTMLREDPDATQDSVFKSIDGIGEEPESKTTYDVAIFASGSWKKMNGGGEASAKPKVIAKDPEEKEPSQDNQSKENLDGDSDAESEGQMIDGILSSGPKQTYELPSQEELIRQAFAGDDVEEDFERAKQEALNEENPEPEKPVLMPGWGQWTDVQQKRGTPKWMVREHEIAKEKREEALKKRKDSRLQHVIISEKVDKKAEKLHTKTLPYPFTSKEVFERSIRMPIGPEFNPASTFRALNRPEVVKRPGVIIKPIEFKEVNPHEKAAEEGKQQTGRRKRNKAPGNARKK